MGREAVADVQEEKGREYGWGVPTGEKARDRGERGRRRRERRAWRVEAIGLITATLTLVIMDGDISSTLMVRMMTSNQTG